MKARVRYRSRVPRALQQAKNQVLLSRSLTWWLPLEAVNRPPHKAICVKSFLGFPRKLGPARGRSNRGNMGVSTACGSVTASTVEEPLLKNRESKWAHMCAL